MRPDIEFLKLLSEVFKTNIPGHLYRGYSVIGGKHSSRQIEVKRLYMYTEIILTKIKANCFFLGLHAIANHIKN